jgi:hypothetical protein
LASRREAWQAKLFSRSNREVFHGVCPCAASVATIPFIALVTAQASEFHEKFSTPWHWTRLRGCKIAFSGMRNLQSKWSRSKIGR